MLHKTVVALVDDLFWRAKIEHAVRSAQAGVVFVSDPAELAGAAPAESVGVLLADLALKKDPFPALAAWRKGASTREIPVYAYFEHVRKDLKERLTRRGNSISYAPSGTTVVLVVGVNGVGKTTSIAKIARHFVREGKKVVLAAADTFRAAAVKQLQTWSERIGCEVVAGADKADPASVAYKGAERALELNADVLLVDTAGRLHTQKNLMDELTKITKVLGNKIPGAPHETILVLDATTGQNAVTQAEMFKAAASVTGLFLAKLDGTAKGGA
ncbi:MAG: hypothetical protein DYH06_12400, partial [Acidobacteria bacterium ACB2]|nr:hypothetical protein [Acidobacteria bacterium ACB2]